MPSSAIESFAKQYRDRKEAGGGPPRSIEELREGFAPGGQIFPVPDDTTIEPAQLAGVPCSWLVSPDANPDRVLLYLHGGGFQVGSLRSHGEVVTRLARATGVPALFPEYRLIPEHPYPAALDDVRAVWRQLRADGVPAGAVVLVGDSAGGCLAMALLVALRDAGEPLPAGAAVLSPMVDLTVSGESVTGREQRDPIFTAEFIRATAAGYLGAADPRDPLVSPLFADLTGLPPLLIQVGSEEVMFSDAQRLAEAAVAAGVETVFEVGEGLPHGYQIIADAPEAIEATNRAGAFLRHTLDRSRVG
jgi:epsilon-lactone hydrolase